MASTTLLDRLDGSTDLVRWTTLYPRPVGHWPGHGMAQDGATVFGLVDPERAIAEIVTPSTDRGLLALSSALGGGQLISYRPGRRAVVATNAGFVKVFRRGRAGAIADTYRSCEAVEGVATPTVKRATRDTVELSHVPGRSLHDVLRQAAAHDGATLFAVGAAIARFHAAEVPTTTTLEDDWVAIVARAERVDHELRTLAVRTADAAGHGTPGRVHGDLHDKQILVKGREVGLIDLDSVRGGETEADLGNFLAHLVLRAIQFDSSAADELHEPFLAGYRSESCLNEDSLAAYRAATFVRLSCLYRFRRAWTHLSHHLLHLAAVDTALHVS